MSESTQEQRECEAFKEDLAAIALGIVSGRRRAQVLEHVAHCPSCNSDLEELSIVADTMLEFAPEIEPPLGFELRLARRLESGAQRHQATHPRRAGVLALAAAVLVVLGFGVGTLVSNGSSNSQHQPATTQLAEASLSSHGHVVGSVILSPGTPSWMLMTIDSGSWLGAVTCEVILAGGKVETLGKYNLSGGYGVWGAPLTSPVGRVRGARLIAPNGAVLASASLRG
jgi:hypothetical protein